MPNLCTVTGVIAAPDGSPIPLAAVTITPAPILPRARNRSVTVPSPVTVTAGVSGQVSVDLTSGTYSVRVTREGRDYPGFLIEVPREAIANLADITFHLSPPQTVYDAQAAAHRAARSAFDALNTFVVTAIGGTTITIQIASHRVVEMGTAEVTVGDQTFAIDTVTLEAAI